RPRRQKTCRRPGGRVFYDIQVSGVFFRPFTVGLYSPGKHLSNPGCLAAAFQSFLLVLSKQRASEKTRCQVTLPQRGLRVYHISLRSGDQGRRGHRLLLSCLTATLLSIKLHCSPLTNLLDWTGKQTRVYRYNETVDRLLAGG